MPQYCPILNALPTCHTSMVQRLLAIPHVSDTLSAINSFCHNYLVCWKLGLIALSRVRDEWARCLWLGKDGLYSLAWPWPAVLEAEDTYFPFVLPWSNWVLWKASTSTVALDVLIPDIEPLSLTSSSRLEMTVFGHRGCTLSVPGLEPLLTGCTELKLSWFQVAGDALWVTVTDWVMSPKFICWNSNPQVTVFADRTFRR